MNVKVLTLKICQKDHGALFSDAHDDSYQATSRLDRSQVFYAKIKRAWST